MPESAVVYVPTSADLEESAATCLEYGHACGYRVRGIVVGRWSDAQTMALDGVVDVVIVAERSHLPPDRVPRIEVVAEHAPPPAPPPDDDDGPSTPPRRRRPKPIGG